MAESQQNVQQNSNNINNNNNLQVKAGIVQLSWIKYFALMIDALYWILLIVLIVNHTDVLNNLNLPIFEKTSLWNVTLLLILYLLMCLVADIVLCCTQEDKFIQAMTSELTVWIFFQIFFILIAIPHLILLQVGDVIDADSLTPRPPTEGSFRDIKPSATSNARYFARLSLGVHTIGLFVIAIKILFIYSVNNLRCILKSIQDANDPNRMMMMNNNNNRQPPMGTNMLDLGKFKFPKTNAPGNQPPYNPSYPPPSPVIPSPPAIALSPPTSSPIPSPLLKPNSVTHV